MHRYLLFCSTQPGDSSAALDIARVLCPGSRVIDITGVDTTATYDTLHHILSLTAALTQEEVVFLVGEVALGVLATLSTIAGFYVCYVHTRGAIIPPGSTLHTYAHQMIVRGDSTAAFELAIRNFLLSASVDRVRPFLGGTRT